jgi:hypothetical protein
MRPPFVPGRAQEQCKDRRDMAPMFHPHPLETWRDDDASPHDMVYCGWTALYVSFASRIPAGRGAMRRHCATVAAGQGAFLLLPKRVAFGEVSMSSAPVRVALAHDSRLGRTAVGRGGVHRSWPRTGPRIASCWRPQQQTLRAQRVRPAPISPVMPRLCDQSGRLLCSGHHGGSAD